MRRLSGVIIIAAICFLIAGYLGTASTLMLVWPGKILRMPGSALLPGLKQGGPSGALLVGMLWAILGWGLLRHHNWARWLTMVIALWGIASILASALEFSSLSGWTLFSCGLQIIVRVAIVGYLFRAAVVDEFSRSRKAI